MVTVRAYIIASIVVFGGIAAGSGLAQRPEDLVLASSLSYAAPAGAEGPGALPANQNVQVNIRQNSFDPTSIITHKINAILTPVEVQGDWVAWEISELDLRRVDALGEDEVMWGADRPAIDTPDGLWWVEHQDPMQPIMEEFTVLPHIAGTATSFDPAVADMLFDMEGSPYVAPPQGSLFPITGKLTYALVAADNPSEPEADGDDDEVEVPMEPDEPYPA